MASYFYILHNDKIDKYYYGSTSNLEDRIGEHNKNSHRSKYTRKQPGGWNLVYFEKYKEKEEARKREIEVKKWKSKKRVRELIEQSR